jgi:phage/plasmid-associated DNA primase
VPANIKRHSDEYRDEMDLVKQWMDERLQKVIGSSTKAMDLYQSFRSWQENNGHRPMTSNALYRLLPSHLGQSTKKADGSYYLDYVVKPW